MGYVKWEIYVRVLIGLVAILAAPICQGSTDPRDVIAINSLYSALGFPPLAGWLLAGGDPCAEGWQGVQCVNSNITGIILNGTNLGGELGENLGLFASIIQIDLSNNHIGGTIPSVLPITLRSIFLSSNELTGSIPDTISLLGELTDLSLNNNHLTGVVPDSFQQLTELQYLGLSVNNLSGQLPPSMGSLSALATLHLQDNHLTGTLNVLQDLPNLVDLNIENNLFSGPIPPKLLSVPNFRSTGNPFNTSIIIVVPPALPPSPDTAAPPEEEHPNQASPPEVTYFSQGKKPMAKQKVVGVVIAGLVAVLIMLALGLSLVMSRCCKQRQVPIEIKRHERDASSIPKLNLNKNVSSLKPFVHSENAVPRKDSASNSSLSKSKDKQGNLKQKEDHQIDMTGLDERVVVKPIVPPTTLSHDKTKDVISARSFTIASLQQYTNSFSQENLIGGGLIGTVYRASLPNRKLLAIKKVHVTASRQWSDEDFLELVSNVSKLQHENVVEFVGYCIEHGQRLLAYGFCRNGTLHEALHLDNELHEKLSWNSRIHVALQAARALEYLHEVCQPAIVHRNFKSANVLLDDDLAVRVSDCGLAPLISSNNITQSLKFKAQFLPHPSLFVELALNENRISYFKKVPDLSTAQIDKLTEVISKAHFGILGSGYGAPELELGSYTYQSDVYSFGVVMLELLTGRKAYDRTQPRGEQFLVRWAIPQLHDIDLLSRMVDPSLRGTYPSKSLSRLADVISLCVQHEPEFRPPMSEIVENLLHMI